MATTRSTPALCGLLPHAPIVVPDVAPRDAPACRATTRACADFARRLVAARPGRLFLVSPHAPRSNGSFGIWSGARLRGDLGAFGLPAASVDLPNDRDFAARLEVEARARGLDTWAIPPVELDHGSVVPLWFLVDAGWAGPTCIVSLPWSAAPQACARLGAAVGTLIAGETLRTALVASGDLSHRATPTAPAGYDPRGVVFDAELGGLIRDGRLDLIPAIDPGLREAAAEDAAESSTVVSAAIGFAPQGQQVLSYEHPFGVGYLVAVFHDGEDPG
jgi:aromatic ring-opening dioxygenase LigB subunit